MNKTYNINIRKIKKIHRNEFSIVKIDTKNNFSEKEF